MENGVNGTEDVEMAEEVEDKPKPHKDGDDEMTVVVPPPNSSKLSAEPEKDQEGDVAMDGMQEDEDGTTKDVVDPRVKAVSGTIATYTYLYHSVY